MTRLSRFTARLARMARMARIAQMALLVVAVATQWPAHAQPFPDAASVRAVVEAAVRPVMARHQLPGLAVGVTVNGQAFVFNYGVSSLQTKRPVDDQTLFEIGSISKTFAATLGAQAQVQGKLSLQDSPGRYLPALRGRPIDQATLLQLLTYTAGGLPLQVPEKIKSDADMNKFLQRWTPAYTPGTRRQYSNVSIGVFGSAVAAALGTRYADAVQSDLLPKLGLHHTYIEVPARAMPHYAWGYDGDKPVRFTPDVFDAQAYGIRTTAADLLRYVQANIDPRGLDPVLRQALDATHQGVYQTGPMTQSLGWEQYPWPMPLEPLQVGNALGRVVSDVTPLNHATSGPRWFNKTGSTRGFGAYAAFVPERRLGIVLLANRGWPVADRVKVAYEVLQALDGQSGSTAAAVTP